MTTDEQVDHEMWCGISEIGVCTCGAGPDDPKERYDCPIHGLQDGEECPRC